MKLILWGFNELKIKVVVTYYILESGERSFFVKKMISSMLKVFGIRYES